MAKARKKNRIAFKADILKEVGYINAIMGFWFGFTYLRYLNDTMSYDDALALMVQLSKYQGS